jgi:CPA1 family monovalent cation:H+ antiporter
MEALTKKHAFLLNHLNEASAEAALNSVQIETLNNLHKNEIITSKLFIMLHNELDETG